MKHIDEETVLTLDERSDIRERDTLPPDSERTSPENEVPRRAPSEFDIEASDAPEWAKVLLRNQREDRAALSRIERNQRLTANEVRRLSRRVGDHDQELEDIRSRVSELEDWRDEAAE